MTKGEITKQELKNYIKNNLKLSLEHRDGKHYIVLTIEDEKVTELNFGEDYFTKLL